MNSTTEDSRQTDRLTIIAVLIMQALTLITSFISQIVAQIHKNKIDEIHEQNTYQSIKIDQIQQAQSSSHSPVPIYHMPTDHK